MSKKTREPREALDLFSVAGLSEHALLGASDQKCAAPTAKPFCKIPKKANAPDFKEEALSERYLRDTAVAERYGVCRQTVWRLAAQGTLPEPVKLSEGITRWRLSDLIAHEAALPQRAKVKPPRPRCANTAKAGDRL